MNPSSTGNTFDDNGGYNAQGSNEFDALNGAPPIEISGDWNKIPDLKGFKPGDTAMLHIKVKLGGPDSGSSNDENGDASGGDSTDAGDNISVLSVKADPMDSGAMAERGKAVDQSAPDLMAGSESM